jgi:hypothetical protein
MPPSLLILARILKKASKKCFFPWSERGVGYHADWCYPAGVLAMRKSLIVELVLLNSVLALSGCTRVCSQPGPRKELDIEERTTWDDEEYPVAQNTCTGSRGGGYHGGGHGIYFHGGGGGRTTTRPGTGTVGRGGFGSTGHAAS